MSLNSRSGSHDQPMTHRAKQQSMNARRRNKNSLKNDSQTNDMVAIPETLGTSENSKKFLKEIITILEPNKQQYIFPIKNSLNENLIRRVEKGTYFEVGGVLYQVTEMPIFEGGNVEAKRMFPENFENIIPRETFTVKEVLHGMVSEQDAQRRILEFVMNHNPLKKRDEYLYMNKEGKSHATLADLKSANDVIKERFYPKRI